MILYKTVQDIRSQIKTLKEKNQKIGFVPTMGALHEGHLSLIRQSKQQTDVTVCSVFVNPTQFNDIKDFEKYPVTIEKDIMLLEQEKVDILFLPAVIEIYPNGVNEVKHYELGYLENILEGKYRPGHFQGVCQVVHRLLEIVQPDALFMGQKDYQQCMVIKKLLEIEQINTELIIVPTKREADGLALSSRNMRLSDGAKEEALAIYKTLNHIKNNIQSTSFEELTQNGADFLLNEGFSKVDYVAIADANTLEPVEKYDPGQKLVALIAAFKDPVRLIDNMTLN
ncbi:pantoate--beta-alanine ligase [Danxiaibacter flavus]|uniref:Pantothenate synthetase n=1 Tax=Danxiaibacter flavus TaxID=3049108 RepID=A0ABV3ZMD4_9BACT|nr:pantoate--beta-alanine ligase [Chitinophagaceae bacterium DXS]